jgi:hypothetical protein
MSDEREAVRLVDYDRTVATIHQLTEVRFKLAAFLPPLTGAAVALLTASGLGPLSVVTLALGGLTFSIGIVLYDLRNSQHYNSAVGRAEHLEAALGFDTFESDKHAGVFGSRRDTTRNMRATGRDRFLGLPVRHGQALALVYTAVIGAWIWAILQAAADGLQSDDSTNWFRTGSHAQWLALAAAALATAFVLRQYSRHDPPPAKKPSRSDSK